jgi:hypothetical protein
MSDMPGPNETRLNLIDGVEYITLRADDFRTAMRERDELRAEVERLRATLGSVGPRLEAHHAAMAAGDLMPCAICGDDEDDGAE